MSKNNLCGICAEPLGFIYMMTRSGYECIPCNHFKLAQARDAINKLPDSVEEMPPVDGKYRSGIIAKNEEAAKAICDAYYEATPGFMDMEN
jgi:hypothetical protein